MNEDQPLDGRHIALPESRQLDLFADMLESRGARVLRCPLVDIRDAPDPAPIVAWLEAFNAGRCDDLILLTGEGLRRLLSAARRADTALHDGFVSRLAQVRKLTRGPKPARALREIGLRSDLAAAEPTTDGVITTLSSLSLEGREVGVQLYGSDPNHKLVDYLTGQGAQVHTVSPYIYADETEDEQVGALIDRLARGDIDAIAFTSSPQVRRLFSVARKRDQQAQLLRALADMTVAAVGPLVADALREREVRVDLMPESSYFMKPLVRKLVERFGPPAD